MGRGGEQHKTIQKRLKSAAEELGFLAVIEKEVLNGDGSIDLALERPGCAIACEITVTTSTDHEFGNVKKCLKAGFARVAVISPSPARLRQIEEAVRGALDGAESARVSFFTPDEFIAHLRNLPKTESVEPEAPAAPAEKKTIGYTVRRHRPIETAEERLAKEEMAMRLIAQSMK